MKKNNKSMATLILVIFTLGFLIAYPFRDNFWIGLLSNMCAASMIGGLADWFAVTAIFRRPLGIYWPRAVFRTEILPRNREGIVNGLVDMVENELLSKESITKKIVNIDLHEILIKYVSNKSINSKFKETLILVVNDFLNTIEPNSIGQLLNESLRKGIEKIEISPLITQFIEFLRTNGYDDKFIDYSIEMFAGLIKNTKTHEFFTNFVEAVIKEYENGTSTRALTIKMLLNFVLKKTPSDIAKILENEIINALYEVRNEDNAARSKIKNEIDKLSGELKSNVELKIKIENWKNVQVKNLPTFEDKLTSIFINYRDKNTNNEISSKVSSSISKYFDVTLEKFINSDSDKKKLELYIKTLIINFVNAKHNNLGLMVRGKLEEFSTEEIVKLIEDIAGNDLQMIRINGSVVGGIVGIVTYLLTYYIK